MSSTAATAMSAPALAQASAAEASARRAECQITLTGFDASKADVAAMREYAACVRVVHGDGEPISAPAVLVIKGIIVICLLCGGACSFRTWQDREDPLDSFAAGIFGLIGGIVVSAVLFAIAFLVAA